MDEIKLFKFKIIELGRHCIYELDINARKQKIVQFKNREEIITEEILDSVRFADKIYGINKNVNLLKEEYIDNTIIDGITINIEITYKNNKKKKIVCKNKFPKEISNIRDIIEI